jgi:hypothetical protein
MLLEYSLNKGKNRFLLFTTLLALCFTYNAYSQESHPRLDGIYIYRNSVKGHIYIGDSLYSEQFKFNDAELANHWQSCINIPRCSKENRIVKADLDSSEKLSIIHFLNDSTLIETEWSCNDEEYIQYVTLLILIHKYGLMSLNTSLIPFQIINDSIVFKIEVFNYRIRIIDEDNLIGSFYTDDPLLPDIREENLDYHFISFNKLFDH